jgi:hypothetical protein
VPEGYVAGRPRPISVKASVQAFDPADEVGFDLQAGETGIKRASESPGSYFGDFGCFWSTFGGDWIRRARQRFGGVPRLSGGLVKHLVKT